MRRLARKQKTAIEALRASGLGYKAIAKALSLSRETVRSYCSRKHISADTTGSRPIDVAGKTGAMEMKSGSTVFVITTGYSEKASETLEEKLEKLILEAVSNQTRSYQ